MTEERKRSRSRRGSTEITLLAKVRPGFVEFADPMTYSKRLMTLLDVFFRLRKRASRAAVVTWGRSRSCSAARPAGWIG